MNDHPSIRRATPFLRLALPLLLATTLQSAEIQVLNNGDAGADTLRAALLAADNGDVITFASGLSGATITLTTGELAIAADLVIDASALDDPLILSGNNTSRVFTVSAGVTATLRSLVIRDGRSANGTNATAGTPGADGGGIHHGGTSLTLIDCTVTNNRTGNGGSASSGSGGRGGRGGGIFNNGGTLHLVSSTLFANTTGSGGNGNTANFGSGGQGGSGGGIFNNGGTLTVLNSTVHGNTTGNGGLGIAGTPGGDGGAIHNAAGGTVTIRQSTLTANSCGNSISSGAPGGRGGGISDSGGNLEIANSIVAANSPGSSGGSPAPGPDLFFVGTNLTRGGVSLIGNNETATTQYPLPAVVGQPNANGDLVGDLGNPFDPVLGDLLDGASGTPVRIPPPGSPVIDRGPVAALPADVFDLDGDSNTSETLPLDQRGSVRVSGPRADLGAVEDTLTAAAALAAQRARLQTQIRALSKQLSLAKKRGLKAKVAVLARRIQVLKQQLARL